MGTLAFGNGIIFSGVSHIIFTLHTNNRASVIINSDEANKIVTVAFECEGICDGMTLEFDLYTGIPSNVISDKDTEAALEALIRETFRKAAKIRKSRESL